MTKMLRINVGNKSGCYENIPEKYRCFGARSLTTRIITDEVDPICDPLGPENKLIIASTVLAGTPVTATKRVSVGAKSPLTGGIKEASSGGMAGHMLAQHGIKAIIVEGAPDPSQWFYLHICADGTQELLDANRFAGMGTFDLVNRLREAHMEKSAVMCIGPAGERQQPIANIMITDFVTGKPCRTAGRGGLGAIMGSKHLKAIVFDPPEKPIKPDFTDEQRLVKAAREYAKLVVAHPACSSRKQFGTTGAIRSNEEKGVLPVKNFRSIPFDGVDKLDAPAFAEFIKEYDGKAGMPCQPGCVVACSQRVNKNGEYLASGIEYETIGLCGSNLLIDDYETIARMTTLAEDYGVDTIEMGSALGVMMEVGLIDWGDGAAVLELCRQMREGQTEYGQLLPTGLRNVSAVLGTDRAPQTKGQAFPAYDPRGMPMMGAIFQSSAQGGDHTAGGPVPDAEGNWNTISKMAEPLSVAVDSLMCMFASIPIQFDPANLRFLTDWMEGLYGGEWPAPKIIDVLGADTLTLEYRFNEKAGVGGIEKLPKFFYEENSAITNAPANPPEDQFQEMYDYFLNRELTQKDW